MKRKLVSILTIAALCFVFFTCPLTAEGTDTEEDIVKVGLVAITFDDGPGPHTEKLLDGLKDTDAKVTFFIVGNRLEEYPEPMIRAYKDGHEIASHSWDHADLTKLSAAEIDENLQKVEDKVYELLGGNIGTLNVRPPKGFVDEQTLSAIDAPIILWNVDTGDWQSRNAESVKQHIIDHAQDGAIILLHDLYESSVDGALAAIEELEEQGYTFVTVNELFRRKGQELTPGVQYTNAHSDGIDIGPLPKDESAQPIVEDSKDKDEKDSDSDKQNTDEEDEGYPVFLLVVCGLVLVAFGAGMLHTLGIITLPLPMAQREKSGQRNRRNTHR